MKIFFIILFCVCSIQNLVAQKKKYFSSDEDYSWGNSGYYVFRPAREKPEFPGGYVGFVKFVWKHIHFPQSVADTMKTRRVITRLMLDKTGKIRKWDFLAADDTLTRQIGRMLEILPDFKPVRKDENRNFEVWLVFLFTKYKQNLYGEDPYIIPIFPSDNKDYKGLIKVIKKGKKHF